MKKPAFVLKPIFVGILSVVASYSSADAVWDGSTGNYQDTSKWGVGRLPDLSLENILINKGQVSLVWDENFPGINQWGGSGETQLVVGGLTGESAGFNIQIAEGASSNNTNYDTALIVGENGGKGTLGFDVTPNSYIQNQGMIFQSINVGKGVDAVSGQKSEGFVNILGKGKNLYQGNMSSSTMASQFMVVGDDGGAGVVNVDGASLDVDGAASNYTSDDIFSIGKGTNSTGVVNVLGGGKLSVSLSSQSTLPITAVVGEDGGTGGLNISGKLAGGLDLDGNPTLVSSRAVFFKGLAVGQGAGSQGNISVKNEGLLLTYGDALVGKDGGIGNVLITGENSRWNVAGEASSSIVIGSVDWSSEGVLTVGTGGGKGSVTIDDSAVVSIGVARTISATNGYTDPETGENFWGYDHEFKGGTGALNLTDSTDSTGALIIKGAEGKVGILDAATVNFGAGTGRLVFNHQDTTGNYEFKPELIGGTTTHSFINNISGVTVLNRDNSQFTGQAVIDGGTLDVNGILGGDMTINKGGTLSGEGTVGNTVLNQGGFISVGKFNTTAPSVLTINGNYQGNNGTVVIDTVLGDDSSATDKLLIKGNTSGNSWVQVNNFGGVGDNTTQGIKIIEVQGASNGKFIQNGRIVAGAYDYFVVRGDALTGADPNSWYLSSKIVGTGGGNNGNINYIRPEAGSYLGLIANNLSVFNHGFYDRQQTLSNQHKSSWMRVVTEHDRYNLAQGDQLNNKVKRKIMQAGTDIYQKDQFHLGVMAGYSHSDIYTKSHLTGSHSKGKSDGYSAGIYATWYDAEAGGLYVDSYAQYNRFRNKVNGQGQRQEVFNTEGYNISLESGYSFMINQTKQTKWTLEPQAQLIYANSSSLNYKEKNGTRIRANQENQLSARVGVRLQAESDRAKFFLTTNYWNQNQYASVNMTDATNTTGKINNNRAKNLFEAKTGVEYSVSEKLKVFGQVNGVYGKNSTEGYGGSVGIKYRW